VSERGRTIAVAGLFAVIAALASALFLLVARADTPKGSPAGPIDAVWGDVNCDGSISIIDAYDILKHDANLDTSAGCLFSPWDPALIQEVVLTNAPTPTGTHLVTLSATPTPTATGIPETPSPTSTPTHGPTPTVRRLAFADVDCDGSPDPLDAIFLLRYILHILRGPGSCPQPGDPVTVDQASCTPTPTPGTPLSSGVGCRTATPTLTSTPTTTPTGSASATSVPTCAPIVTLPPSATPSATPTPTPVSCHTPDGSQTATPTLTPTPTATATPTPSPSPSPDTQPPLITDIWDTPDPICDDPNNPTGNTVTITATITDPSGVASATLYYQFTQDAVPGPNYDSEPANNTGGDSWQASLTANETGNGHFFWYWEASDNANNTTGPVPSPFDITTVNNCNS
jgi:hypothetical protein